MKMNAWNSHKHKSSFLFSNNKPFFNSKLYPRNADVILLSANQQHTNNKPNVYSRNSCRVNLLLTFLLPISFPGAVYNKQHSIMKNVVHVITSPTLINILILVKTEKDLLVYFVSLQKTQKMSKNENTCTCLPSHQ